MKFEHERENTQQFEFSLKFIWRWRSKEKGL